MEDTLQVGDRVLVNKITYRLRPIERGDVLVFDGTDSFVEAGDIPKRDPITGAISWLGQSIGVVPPDSTDFVKRVIGVAGDHVVCCDGEVVSPLTTFHLMRILMCLQGTHQVT